MVRSPRDTTYLYRVPGRVRRFVDVAVYFVIAAAGVVGVVVWSGDWAGWW